MQTTRKAVRYYIDREADTPVIRTVPVSRPSAVAPSAAALPREPEQDTATFPTADDHRISRHRITSMVQARVRKNRHHAS